MPATFAKHSGMRERGTKRHREEQWPREERGKWCLWVRLTEGGGGNVEEESGWVTGREERGRERGQERGTSRGTTGPRVRPQKWSKVVQLRGMWGRPVTEPSMSFSFSPFPIYSPDSSHQPIPPHVSCMFVSVFALWCLHPPWPHTHKVWESHGQESEGWMGEEGKGERHGEWRRWAKGEGNVKRKMYSTSGIAISILNWPIVWFSIKPLPISLLAFKSYLQSCFFCWN